MFSHIKIGICVTACLLNPSVWSYNWRCQLIIPRAFTIIEISQYSQDTTTIRRINSALTCRKCETADRSWQLSSARQNCWIRQCVPWSNMPIIQMSSRYWGELRSWICQSATSATTTSKVCLAVRHCARVSGVIVLATGPSIFQENGIYGSFLFFYSACNKILVLYFCK